MKTLAQPYEYEGLLIDAVYADLQVRSLRMPDGCQNGAARAYAAVVGASFEDALAEVQQIAGQVSASTKLGATRLDVRKAVARHTDRLLANQAPEEAPVEAKPDACGEGMCRCYCVGRQHDCGCDCGHDDDCDCDECTPDD